MKEQAMNAAGKLTGYGTAAGVYMISVDEIDSLLRQFEIEVPAKYLGLLALAIGFGVHRLPWAWGKVRPIVGGLYRKVLKWAGAALIILLPSVAHATAAKVVLTCSSTVTQLEEVPGVGVRESEECASPTSWLDVAVGVDIVALQLTGKRQVVSLGAAPSFGLLLAWKPETWTATPMALGAELNFAMTVISPEIAEGSATHVESWVVAAFNVMGWFAVGVGGRFGFAIREGYNDFANLVLTGGLRLPL